MFYSTGSPAIVSWKEEDETKHPRQWAFSSFLGINVLELAKKRPYCLLKTEPSEQGPVWEVLSSLCGSSLLGLPQKRKSLSLGDPAPPMFQVMAQSHLRFEDELLGSM